jgi:hypothetical protein
MTEYQVTYDDAFLVEMVRRYRQIHTWRWLRVALKLLATGFLAIDVVSSIYQQWWGMAAMWGAAIAALWASPWIDYWRVKRRFRLSPFHGERVHISLGAEGVHTVGRTHNSRLTWMAYSHAVVLSDGVLLYWGPDLFQWLPDSAIVSGKREDVVALLRDGHQRERGEG